MFEVKLGKKKYGVVPKRVFYKENRFPKVFWDVDIYVGDPWYPPANGWIHDFRYEINY